MKNKLGLKPVLTQPTLRLADYYTSALPSVESLTFPLGHADAIKPEMFCNDRLGDCITPDTKVLTADLQWVAAGSLRVGDKLLGFDEEHSGGNGGRRFKECDVTNATIVTRPCYELTFADGTTVTSSEGHLWLTKSTAQGQLGCQRWERTEDLRVGAVRQTKVIKPLDVWEEERSWHGGYLAGAFDGEGNLENYYSTAGRPATHTRVNFSQTDNEMLHQVELSLKELGFEPTNYIHQRHSQARVDGTPRKSITRISIGNRSQFLRFMGSVRPRRLLAKMTGNYGRISGDSVALVSKVHVGEREVVMLDTTSRTYFANGLASHNCAIAGSIEEIRLANTLAGKPVEFTDAQAEQAYHEITGWNPGPDDGTDVRQLFDYRQATGIADAAGTRHKIVAYAGLTPGDFGELLVALSIFDMVGIGIQVPDFCEAQFEAGQPWHLVPGRHSIEGGHYVPVVGATDRHTAQLFSWGALGGITEAFYAAYNTVAVVALTEEMFTGGKSPEGVDFARMAADLKLFDTGPVTAKAPRGKRADAQA